MPRLSLLTWVICTLTMSLVGCGGGGGSGGGGGGSSTPTRSGNFEVHMTSYPAASVPFQSVVVNEYNFQPGSQRSTGRVFNFSGQNVAQIVSATTLLSSDVELECSYNCIDPLTQQQQIIGFKSWYSAGESIGPKVSNNILTTIADFCIRVLNSPQGTVTLQAVDKARSQEIHSIVVESFGFDSTVDPRTLIPVDLTHPAAAQLSKPITDEVRLGLIEVSLAQLAATEPELGDLFNACDRVTKDFVDFVFDGRIIQDVPGQAIVDLFSTAEKRRQMFKENLVAAMDQFLNSPSNQSGFVPSDFASFKSRILRRVSLPNVTNTAPDFTFPQPAFVGLGQSNATIVLTDIVAGQLDLESNQMTTFSVTSSNPSVLTVNNVSPLLNGEVTISVDARALGVARLTVRAEDDGAQGSPNYFSKECEHDVQVIMPPAFQSLSLPVARTNNPYSEEIVIEVEKPNTVRTTVQFTGSLPFGMSRGPEFIRRSANNQNYYVVIPINGMSNSIGSSTLTVTAVTGQGVAQTTANITIDVVAGQTLGSSPIGGNGSVNLRVEDPFVVQYQVVGGIPPYTIDSAASLLPPGVNYSLQGDVVTISGAVTEPVSDSFSVRVRDSGISSSSVSVRFDIQPAWTIFTKENNSGNIELYGWDPHQVQTTPYRLHTALAGSQSVKSFSVTPDGRYVAFVADLRTLGVDELFVVELNLRTPGPASIVDFLMPGEAVLDVVCTSDLTVYYRVLTQSGGPVELRSAAIFAGQSPLTFNDLPRVFPSAPNQSATVQSPPSSPNSPYRYAQDGETLFFFIDATQAGAFEFASMDVSARTTTSWSGSDITHFVGETEFSIFAIGKLNASAPRELLWGTRFTPTQFVSTQNTGFGRIFSNQLATACVFEADLDVSGLVELYVISAPADPFNPIVPSYHKLNPALSAGSTVTFYGAALAENGQFVVYCADSGANTKPELFYVDISQGTPQTPVKISGVNAGSIGVSSALGNTGFQITPDSTRILFLADNSVANSLELFAIDVSSQSFTPVRLSALPATGSEGVKRYLLSNDGSSVMFSADANISGTQELFEVQLSTPSTPLLRSGTTTPGSDIGTGDKAIFEDPTGRYLLFQADRDTNGVFELYWLDRSLANPVIRKVNNPLSVGERIVDVQMR